MPAQKFNVGFCFFPYGGNGGTSSETPDIRKWLIPTLKKMYADPRIGDIFSEDFSDTPITMTRNKAVEWAQKCPEGIDILVMIDSDQSPDIMLAIDPTAKPFWDSSFDFFCQHYSKGPCVIFGAYCGPPTHPLGWGEENPYVFTWANRNSHEPTDMRLAGMTREHAAMMTGIGEMGAGPTGLIMFDMRAFDLLPKPYFYYDYEQQGLECPHCHQRERGPETEKSATEDVNLTRNISLAGIVKLGYNPLYCNWDAWAGHWKPKCVGKPRVITASQVGMHLKQAVLENVREGQRIVNLGVPKLPPGTVVRERDANGVREFASGAVEAVTQLADDYAEHKAEKGRAWLKHADAITQTPASLAVPENGQA